jgi:putative sigma-54 modulation protein
MNVEYTARKYEITPTVRKEVETGLNKIRKILGDRFETKVILAVEKRRHKAEITINPPNGPIVGLAQTTDMLSAVNEALDHLHKQALKYKTKWLSKKRKAVKKFDGQSLEENLETALGLGREHYRFRSGSQISVGGANHRSAPRAFQGLGRASSDDAGRSDQRGALPRQGCFRVSATPRAVLMVLHRTRDGKMELIEAP